MRTRWLFAFDIDAPIAPDDLVGLRGLITNKFAPIRYVVTRRVLNSYIEAGSFKEAGSYVVKVQVTIRGIMHTLYKR